MRADIHRAIQRYEEALRKEAREHEFKTLESDEKEAKLGEVKKQKISTHLNLAAAHLRLDDPKEALRHCNSVIELDPLNVKALYRRGQAHLKLGDISGARSDLMEAAKREPQNKDVRKELEKLKVQATALKQQQKNVRARCV